MRRSLGVLLAAACLLAAAPAFADGPTVKVGSKSYTESVILGELTAHVLRGAGAAPIHRAELGGTQVLWKALRAGEIDVYTEYTGTITQEILPGARLRDDEAIRKALARFHVRMSRRLGFNDTYAMGMKEELAERLNIKSISDLKSHPDLTFGVSDEFLERPDGLPGLKDRYGLKPHGVRSMDHNMALRGLDRGSVQVTDLFSTDAEIKYYHIRVLEDDLGFFPSYYAVLLSRDDLAERAPAAAESLHTLENLIDNDEMVELNARVKMDRVSETRAAAEFLNRKTDLAIPIPEDTIWEVWKGRFVKFLQNTEEHLFLVAVSLTAAVLIAIPLGVWAYKRPRLGKYILGGVGVIQTLPSLAVLVFLIPLLGLGAAPAIVALFLYSLLPIVRNTYTGLQEMPANLRESALVLGLPARFRLWRVELPLASRSILSGVKTAAVINVGTATLGALIGAGGYGQPIITGIRLDDIGLILQGAIPAAVLALLVQGLFSLAERWVVPQGLLIK
jgi:osmoprotectant transport system permease protein